MSDIFRIEKPSYDAASRRATFPYTLGDLRFTETLDFPAGADAAMAMTPAFAKMLDLTAIVLGASYFKLTAPTRIDSAMPLSANERAFALDVYTNGLGEFYARNNLAHFDKVTIAAPSDDVAVAAPATLGDRVLLPIGGGKDSLVSVQLFERAKVSFTPFAVNPKGPIVSSVDAIDRTPLYVTRTLDPEMLRRAKMPGYLNGHVPSTAINSMIAALTALLFSYRRIALSNERSASEGNVVHDGREVNHQYSKSLEFERRIAEIIAAASGGAIGYFSLLRAYSEAKIARLFARETRFDHVFSSCNRNFRLGGHDGPLWCGECPKCHFTFLILAPVMPKARLLSIFGQDLLDKPANEASYRELTGLAGQKPWECVGEIEEAAACLHALSERPEWRDTAIVRTLRPELDRQYPPPRLANAMTALMADAPDHHVPADLAARIAPHAL